MFAFRGVHFLLRSVLVLRGVSSVLMEFFVTHFFVVFAGASQGFTGKQFDRKTNRGRRQGRSRGLMVLMRLSVIVVLEIFENVADVEESVAIEANVHESRLHTGEDAGDSSFVDAADEGEFFFALDVNFD